MVKKKNDSFKSVDKLSHELDVVDNFVLRHWKRYAIVAAIFVVILAIVLIVSKTRSESSVRVSQEVISASTIPELQTVIKKYPDYASIDFARLTLASKLVDNKKYAEAITIYDNEINSSDSTAYARGIGQLNKAYVLETQQQAPEAAKQFETLANNTNLPVIIRCQSSYAAGRIFNSLGKTQQAVSMLEQCVADKGNCQLWPEMAAKILNRIE